MIVTHGLLTGLDARDARELEDRDAELLDAERADQWDGHEYAVVPTLRALEYLAQRDEPAVDEPARACRGILLGLALGSAAWLAALGIAISLGAFR